MVLSNGRLRDEEAQQSSLQGAHTQLVDTWGRTLKGAEALSLGEQLAWSMARSEEDRGDGVWTRCTRGRKFSSRGLG